MLRLCGLRVAEEPERDAVDEEADDRDREHQPGRDLRRRRQPAPRLVQDEGGHGEQERGVGDGRQDLQPQVAEGPFVVGRPRADPDGQQGQPDPDDVGQDVAGVGQQRQAVGRQAADELDDEDARPTGRGRREPAGSARAGEWTWGTPASLGFRIVAFVGMAGHVRAQQREGRRNDRSTHHAGRGPAGHDPGRSRRCWRRPTRASSDGSGDRKRVVDHRRRAGRPGRRVRAQAPGPRRPRARGPEPGRRPDLHAARRSRPGCTRRRAGCASRGPTT